MKINQRRSFQLSREVWIAGIILVVALIVRLYGGWCLRFHLNLDAGVVALMAKHMAEGISFPVFFYGQAYMGSLEPAVSALFCKIFGVSGFAISMGTVLLGMLLLPVVYFWTRDIAGRTAAVAAMLFCTIGPAGFLHYSVSPRGGYAAIMLFGTLALWLSSRIVIKTIQNDRPPVVDYLLLGLAGGFGWWSSQLVVSALFASALLLVIGLRSRAFTWRLLLGLAGFFLGSLPFWVYNALNDWPTFFLMGSLGTINFWEGVRLFFVDRFLFLVGLSDNTPALLIAGLSIYVTATVITLYAFFHSLREKNPQRWVPLLAAFLFLLFSVVIFSTSHFAVLNTPRYLLPLVPFIAVLLGVMTSFLCGRLPYALGWLPLLFLISLQLPMLQWAWEFQKDEQVHQEHAESVSLYLKEHDIKAAYAMINLRSWNFALREKVAISQVEGTFYKAYEQLAELEDSPAILGNYGLVDEFFQATSAKADETVIGGLQVHHGFAPPNNGIDEIPFPLWQSVRDSSGKDIFSQLTDSSVFTAWHSPQAPHDDWIEITFHEPVPVSGLRLWTDTMASYPRALQIVGQQRDDAPWQVLHPATPISFYFWSGNRPFWFGDLQRIEYRFAPALIKKLRLQNMSSLSFHQHWHWKIHFLQVFSPAAALPSEQESFPDLLKLLLHRGVKYLYADRWEANAVHRATSGKIWTPLDSQVFPSNQHPLASFITGYLFPISSPHYMILTEDTALLVRIENAPLVRNALAQQHIDMDEIHIGPWILFNFSTGQWSGDDAQLAPLRWTGFGCLLNPFRDNRVIHPELVGPHGFFYDDNNWTTGDTRIIGINYLTQPDDRYLVLSLKSQPPHGQDRDSLDIRVWINGSRLPFSSQEGWDFYFKIKPRIKTIKTIRITSDTFIPKKLRINEDTRVLGLMVDSIWLTHSLPAR